MSRGPADTGAPRPDPSSRIRPATRPVLVTRPAGRGDALVDRLTALGLTAEHHPLTRLVPAPDEELGTLRARLAGGEYTHLVVTSRTAVETIVPVVAPPTTEVVAVGAGTADALRAAGLPVHRIAGGSGAALVEEMPTAPPHATVLFPASAAASRTVPEGLAAKGYRVDEVTAYHPELVELPAAVASALRTGGYGAIALTSPMIARAAAENGVHESTSVVTLGHPTSEAARAAGLAVAAQADSATDEALARAVHAVLGAAPSGPPSPLPSAAPSTPPSAAPSTPPSGPRSTLPSTPPSAPDLS